MCAVFLQRHRKLNHSEKNIVVIFDDFCSSKGIVVVFFKVLHPLKRISFIGTSTQVQFQFQHFSDFSIVYSSTLLGYSFHLKSLYLIFHSEHHY